MWIALLATSGLAAWEATDESRATAKDFLEALGATGLSAKEAASRMDMSVSQLSDQLANRAHLSLWRLTMLPAKTQAEFFKRRLARFGYYVVEDAAIADLIRAVSQRRQMVKAELERAS